MILTHWITGAELTAFATSELPVILLALSAEISLHVGQTVTLARDSITSLPGQTEVSSQSSRLEYFSPLRISAQGVAGAD